MTSDVLIVPRLRVKEVKDSLSRDGHFDNTKKIVSVSRDHYAVAITTDGKEVLLGGHVPDGCVLSKQALPPVKPVNPHHIMQDALCKLLPRQPSYGLPHHWIKHGDLVVLPSNSFSGPDWDDLIGPELWGCVAASLGAKRLAREDHVIDDNYRTPSCELLLGNDGWVEHVDNKVCYVFDVTKNMFCHGNITEKIRLSRLPYHDNEVVLDMFAGIGYFTLPLLMHTPVSKVHSCDWSGDAIDALHKGLVANKVLGRCVIHHVDCRKLQLPKPVDRVILGLIPSAQCGYETACRHANTTTGTWMHVHGVVNSKPVAMETDISKRQYWYRWAGQVTTEIKELLITLHHNTSWSVIISHVEHVKSYAPHMDHVVVDVHCTALS